VGKGAKVSISYQGCVHRQMGDEDSIGRKGSRGDKCNCGDCLLCWTRRGLGLGKGRSGGDGRAEEDNQLLGRI